MPSILNSDDGVVSGTSGLKSTGGNDGITAFQQNGTERMRIDSSGNVGIGTSSPGTKFDVNGTITGRNGAKITGALASITATSTLFLEQDSSSSARILVAGADAGTSPTFSTVLINNASGVFGSTTLYESGLAVKSLGINGTTPSSSGAGITFPATQSASSNANTLDDYEEGTFTPTFVSGITSITYAIQNGFYTKVGRLVNFTLQINISAGTGNGTIIEVGGLPFTSNSTNGYFSSAVFGYTSNALVNSTSTNLPTLYLAPSDTKISFYKTNGTNFTSSDCADVTQLDLYISGFFFTS